MTTVTSDNSLAPDCLSDLALDEWIAGELRDPQRALLGAHIEGCARCRTRIDTIEAEAAAFLSRTPSLSAHTQLAAELAETKRKVTRKRIVMTASAGFALAAAVALAVMPQRAADDGAASETTRVKGSAHIDFFVKRGQTVTQGASGDAVHPGDLLRFTHTSLSDTQFALINIDGRGVTVYYPTDSSTSAPIKAGQNVALDFSVELDERIGSEHIYAVFCPEPFVLSDAIKTLSVPQPMPPAQCQLDTVTLQKAPSP